MRRRDEQSIARELLVDSEETKEERLRGLRERLTFLEQSHKADDAIGYAKVVTSFHRRLTNGFQVAEQVAASSDLWRVSLSRSGVNPDLREKLLTSNYGIIVSLQNGNLPGLIFAIDQEYRSYGFVSTSFHGRTVGSRK